MYDLLLNRLLQERSAVLFLHIGERFQQVLRADEDFDFSAFAHRHHPRSAGFAFSDDPRSPRSRCGDQLNAVNLAQLALHFRREGAVPRYRFRVGLTASLSSGLAAGFAFFGFRHFACSTAGLCAVRFAFVVEFGIG